MWGRFKRRADMNINMNDDAILLEVKIAPDTSYENIIDSMSLNNFVSSVRSSSGYHGLLEGSHFFRFFKFFRF